jgi:hypothetical protein
MTAASTPKFLGIDSQAGIDRSPIAACHGLIHIGKKNLSELSNKML